MVHLGERAGRPRRMLASYTILVTTICALLTACLLSPPAWAQGFPTRPIKIVVGPSPDVFARIVGEHLQQAWGQPVIVEPRPGAGGKLAAAAVASAEPDGHTLLFATPTYTLNAAMKLASYDLVKEFEAVSIIGLISYALVVHPGVPARSVAELVALAKSRPGGLNCGSAGIGTVPHLACETLNRSAGVNVVHVPYRDVNRYPNIANCLRPYRIAGSSPPVSPHRCQAVSRCQSRRLRGCPPRARSSINRYHHWFLHRLGDPSGG